MAIKLDKSRRITAPREWTREGDWHRADIMAALRKAGWTMRALSHAHHLHGSTCERALRRPYPRAERIIADALGVAPSTIWPSRYNPDGSPRRRRRSASRASSQSTAREALCNGDRPTEICPPHDSAVGSLGGYAVATTLNAAERGAGTEAAA